MWYQLYHLYNACANSSKLTIIAAFHGNDIGDRSTTISQGVFVAVEKVEGSWKPHEKVYISRTIVGSSNSGLADKNTIATTVFVSAAQYTDLEGLKFNKGVDFQWGDVVLVQRPSNAAVEPFSVVVDFKLSPSSLFIVDSRKITVPMLFTSVVSVMTTLATLTTILGSAFHYWFGRKHGNSIGMLLLFVAISLLFPFFFFFLKLCMSMFINRKGNKRAYSKYVNSTQSVAYSCRYFSGP